MTSIFTKKQLLIIILSLALLFRFFRLDYPKAYIFDEVYHGFTAKEYVKGSKEAWEWWTLPPKGVAFEWTHPPLAKELMAASLKIFSTEDPWGWRIPGAALGVISVYLIYLIGKKLFNENVGLLTCFIFSVDGLNFVQSRTGMNDIYLVTFILGAFLLSLHQKYFLSSLLAGLALASKWTGSYAIAGLIILLILQTPRQWWKATYYILIPAGLYLISYLPFFLLGHDWGQFIELQKQMWWYHTHLKASHDYSSPWWSWPLNLYPVWYFVEYGQGSMANIFASGNPMVFWLGFLSIIISLGEVIKKRAFKLCSVVFLYLLFWLPWALSPRIMFLYHYSPSVPFLTLSLGFQLHKLRNTHPTLFLAGVGLIASGFLLVYPFLTGLMLPREAISIFFATNLAKNPFR